MNLGRRATTYYMLIRTQRKAAGSASGVQSTGDLRPRVPTFIQAKPAQHVRPTRQIHRFRTLPTRCGSGLEWFLSGRLLDEVRSHSGEEWTHVYE